MDGGEIDSVAVVANGDYGLGRFLGEVHPNLAGGGLAFFSPDGRWLDAVIDRVLENLDERLLEAGEIGAFPFGDFAREVQTNFLPEAARGIAGHFAEMLERHFEGKSLLGHGVLIGKVRIRNERRYFGVRAGVP